MARIHEVAKELGVSSKEVIDFLGSELNIVAKSHSSAIDDDAKAKVVAHFKKDNKTEASAAPAKSVDNHTEDKKPVDKPVEKTPEKPAQKAPEKSQNTQAGTEKSSAEAAQAKPKKKSSITAVFNPRYAGDRDRRRPGQGNGKRPQGQGQGNRENGNRNRPQGQGAQQNSVHRPIKPRSGAGPIRADGTREGEPTLAEIRAKEAEEAKKRALEESKAREAEAKKQAETAAVEAVEKKPELVRRENIYDRKPNNDRNNENRSQDRNNRNDRNDRNNRNNNGDRNRNDRNGNGPKNGNRPNNKNGRVEMDAQPAPDSRNNSRKKNNDHKKNDRRDKQDRKAENFQNLEKNGGKKNHKPQQPKAEEEIKSIQIPDRIILRDLADRMKLQPSVLIKKLFMKGIVLTLNSEIDYEKAEEIALEFNILCEHEEQVDVIEEMLKEEEEDPKDLTSHPPVVCVMGHVDHGKTSLLDAIRNTKVTDREAGGITQKIGAYVVDINGQKITFLDTPGHEAFTAMRMRGAKSTDIAVLVVAADDGVMPQTVEAINHAKAAGVEVIVAVNKIDKPAANIDRVKQELAEYELIPEDWGGSTIFAPVSAKTGEGIDNLLDMILLTAEVMELKANKKRAARGLVIEAQLDKGRGPVATVLVQKGTLHVGDAISAGSSYGKIRAMTDEHGRRVKAAGPSVPVEVQGLSDVPNAGEIFVAHKNEKEARAFAQEFVNVEKSKLVDESRSRMSLDNLFNQVQAGNVKELDIIVKADVQGSVEAVKQSLEKLSNDEVVVKCIHGGVGAITESDVVLASASNAIIIGFNVRPDAVAKDMSERENVDIHLYSVIYNAIEDVESAMKGMLEPIYEEKVLGHGEVRQTFKSSGVGIIAGSVVSDGIFQRGCKIRLTRDGKQLYDGPLASLKRFKDDVKEVREGYECGVVLDNFTDIQEGDQMEAYTMVEVPRT